MLIGSRVKSPRWGNEQIFTHKWELLSYSIFGFIKESTVLSDHSNVKQLLRLWRFLSQSKGSISDLYMYWAKVKGKVWDVWFIESPATVPLILTLRLISAGGKFTYLSNCNLIKFTFCFIFQVFFETLLRTLLALIKNQQTFKREKIPRRQNTYVLYNVTISIVHRKKGNTD